MKIKVSKSDYESFSKDYIFGGDTHGEKRMSEMRARGTSFRPTTDDWYPNFPGELVALWVVPPVGEGILRHPIEGGKGCEPFKGQLAGLSSCRRPIEQWLIRISGADDTIMCYTAESKEEAQRVYRRLPLVISRDDLFARGFTWD